MGRDAIGLHRRTRTGPATVERRTRSRSGRRRIGGSWPAHGERLPGTGQAFRPGQSGPLVEADTARAHGAPRGWGSSAPSSWWGDERHARRGGAYKSLQAGHEASPPGAWVIRTFDLGGDNFPPSCNMPKEENPIPWGGGPLRVCRTSPTSSDHSFGRYYRASAHGGPAASCSPWERRGARSADPGPLPGGARAEKLRRDRMHLKTPGV